MVPSGVRFGRHPNMSVRIWLEQRQAAVARLPFVLVSSMDSDRMVSNMPWAVARCQRDPDWAISTSPLVISGSATVALLDETYLFGGFDELWVPSQLPVANPPNEAFLVAPRELDLESHRLLCSAGFRSLDVGWALVTATV